MSSKVRARLAEPRAPVVEAMRDDFAKAMAEAEKARVRAMELGQASEAVAAVTLKAKMSGLLVEERDHENESQSEMKCDEGR